MAVAASTTCFLGSPQLVTADGSMVSGDFAPRGPIADGRLANRSRIDNLQDHTTGKKSPLAKAARPDAGMNVKDRRPQSQRPLTSDTPLVSSVPSRRDFMAKLEMAVACGGFEIRLLPGNDNPALL